MRCVVTTAVKLIVKYVLGISISQRKKKKTLERNVLFSDYIREEENSVRWRFSAVPRRS